MLTITIICMFIISIDILLYALICYYAVYLFSCLVYVVYF